MAVISVITWRMLRASELVDRVNGFPLFPVSEDGEWLW